MLHIITFQNVAMAIDFCKEDRVYPFNLEETIIATNYSRVTSQCYRYMYDAYNSAKNTNYDGFFWGFIADTISSAKNFSIYKRIADMHGSNDAELKSMVIADMLGLDNDDLESMVVMELDIPDDFGLVTDFYYWSDLIYYKIENISESVSSDNLVELKRNLFNDRKSVKQIVFPYIDRSMISDVYMARELLEKRD